MPTPDTLTLRPDDHTQAQALAWLQTQAQRRAWPQRTLFALQLCLEEALANVLMHGFADPPRDTDSIELQLHENGEQVTLQLRDNGPAFDPTRAAPPTLAASVDEAVAGGHGLRLMRHYLHDLAYERVGQYNQLSLVAALPADAAGAQP